MSVINYCFCKTTLSICISFILLSLLRRQINGKIWKLYVKKSFYFYDFN